MIYVYGSSGTLPTQDCTHFLYNGFVVARCGLNSYYNPQCIQLDKEIKFYAYKKI